MASKLITLASVAVLAASGASAVALRSGKGKKAALKSKGTKKNFTNTLMKQEQDAKRAEKKAAAALVEKEAAAQAAVAEKKAALKREEAEKKLAAGGTCMQEDTQEGSGGSDDDQAVVNRGVLQGLVDFCVEEFKRENSGKNPVGNVRAMRRLRNACEHTLRNKSNTKIYIEIDLLFEGIDFNCVLCRACFEQGNSCCLKQLLLEAAAAHQRAGRV